MSMTAHKHAESRIWIAVFDSIFILFYFFKNKQIASFNSSFSSQSYYPQLFFFFFEKQWWDSTRGPHHLSNKFPFQSLTGGFQQIHFPTSYRGNNMMMGLNDTMMLWMPCSCRHSRSGWTGLWAPGLRCRCPCSLEGSWTRWTLGVPSNSNGSMIL